MKTDGAIPGYLSLTEAARAKGILRPVLWRHVRAGHLDSGPSWGIPIASLGPKRVARHVDLDPSIVQSGEQHRQGRISKAGSPRFAPFW